MLSGERNFEETVSALHESFTNSRYLLWHCFAFAHAFVCIEMVLKMTAIILSCKNNIAQSLALFSLKFRFQLDDFQQYLHKTSFLFTLNENSSLSKWLLRFEKQNWNKSFVWGQWFFTRHQYFSCRPTNLFLLSVKFKFGKHVIIWLCKKLTFCRNVLNWNCFWNDGRILHCFVQNQNVSKSFVFLAKKWHCTTSQLSLAT